MELLTELDLDLGDLRLRTLSTEDAALLVEATRAARLVGALGLMVDGPHSAELAYWVRPEQRRRGIALRGVEALTAWAHTTAGLARVWLEINPDNTPSLQLAQRAGYRLEQRLPRHCRDWTKDDPDQDTWHDCIIWVHTP